MSDVAYQELIDIFHLPNNTRGIELGCGDGPFARRLQYRNLDIYGLDISFPLLQLTENMTPIQGNALKLPFKDNFFHWVIYAFSLHHIPHTTNALEEAIRVLDDTAKIYLVEPNYYHPVRFLTRKPETFLRTHVFTYLSPDEHWIPLFKIKKILRKNHVVIDKVIFLTPEFESSTLSGRLQRLLGKILNFWPANMVTQSYYIVIGTKTA
jgi:ubiquinone/menaquinone biosynthesis C-methylase UbiE